MAKRSGIQLLYPFEEKRLLTWQLPVFVQPKLDGERARGIFSAHGSVLVSSEINVFQSIPHIDKQLVELWGKTGFNELDGELYVHGMQREEIHSIVSRTVNLHPRHTEMEYHIFDIVDETLPQIDRMKKLRDLAPFFGSSLKLVPVHIAESLEDIIRFYNHFIELGYEGIVVRNMDAPYIRRRSIYAMKFKPKKFDIYKIVGFKEEVSILGIPKDRLGSLVCSDPEGNVFGVSNFTDDLRESLWKRREELLTFDCKVGYQHISGKNKVPLSAVFKDLVEREPETSFVNPLT